MWIKRTESSVVLLTFQTGLVLAFAQFTSEHLSGESVTWEVYAAVGVESDSAAGFAGGNDVSACKVDDINLYILVRELHSLVSFRVC